MKSASRPARVACIFAFWALAACDGYGESSALPEDERLITGFLAPPGPELGQRPIAIQPIAIAIDGREGDPLRSIRHGTSFSPAKNGGQPVRFAFTVSARLSYVLLLQTPGQGVRGLGRWIAPLVFAAAKDGAIVELLPATVPGARAPDIELGVLKIEGGSASNSEAKVTLGAGASNNPLAQNDADGDSTPDFDDADDDDDFVPDSGDPDAGGDGIPDQEQGLEALRKLDSDGDRIPDWLDPE